MDDHPRPFVSIYPGGEPRPGLNGLLPHGTPVWQRNYWDRVIRDDAEHERIAKYIHDNPANWKGDRFNR